MEKYNVQIDEKSKTAGVSDGKCPECGGRVIVRHDLNVPVCEFCGTKPFEKKPEQK